MLIEADHSLSMCSTLGPIEFHRGFVQARPGVQVDEPGALSVSINQDALTTPGTAIELLVILAVIV